MIIIKTDCLRSENVVFDQIRFSFCLSEASSEENFLTLSKNDNFLNLIQFRNFLWIAMEGAYDATNKEGGEGT